MQQLTLTKAPVLLGLFILVVAIPLTGCLPLTQQQFGQTAPTPGAGTSMRLISRGVPAFASSGTASYANGDSFDTSWSSNATPAWLAYDLSNLPASARRKVLLVFYNESYNYDNTIINTYSYSVPEDYTIDVNPAPGGGQPPTSGWKTVVTVTGSHYHSRQHVFDMTGNNWVRINVTAVDGALYNMNPSFKMDVYDASHGTDDDFIDFGDSITATSMGHDTSAGTKSFADLIHAQIPNRFPVEEAGGIGYLASADGVKYINTWLALFPGKYVGLSYGTNDSWGCGNPPSIATGVYNNYVTMVKAVIAAGKIPVVPHMIWSPRSDLQTCAVAINAELDQLHTAYPQVIAGPDLYTVFQNHPEYFSDRVHPNSQGVAVYRQAWANTFITSIYKSKALLPTPTPTPVGTNYKNHLLALASKRTFRSSLACASTTVILRRGTLSTTDSGTGGAARAQ